MKLDKDKKFRPEMQISPTRGRGEGAPDRQFLRETPQLGWPFAKPPSALIYSSAGGDMDIALLRAWWAHKQGLDESLAGKSAAEVLAKTGWARSASGVYQQ